MTDNKTELAKKAIITGKTKAQFLAEHVGADLEEYAEAYNRMIAYRDEICADNGSTFD